MSDTAESDSYMLLHRAVKFCSQTELQSENEFVIKILMDNDYQLDVGSRILTKWVQLKKTKLGSPEIIHLERPCVDEFSTGINKQNSENVKFRCV